MWLDGESGVDLRIPPLVIWSVGWIIPLHQIQSTPDMSLAEGERETETDKALSMSKDLCHIHQKTPTATHII